MRIIAGKLKGSNLYVPKNKTIRPLKDRARESIFNLLTHSNKTHFQLIKSKVLDLYAGTGSFGLECLSRNAKNVFFVENAKDAIEVLEKNIDKLQLKKNTKIYFQNVLVFIGNETFSKSKFDLIFCDPPFKDSNIIKIIEYIYNNNMLKNNS